MLERYSFLRREIECLFQNNVYFLLSLSGTGTQENLDELIGIQRSSKGRAEAFRVVAVWNVCKKS
jgi:hypothetical protein